MARVQAARAVALHLTSVHRSVEVSVHRLRGGDVAEQADKPRHADTRVRSHDVEDVLA